MHHTTVFATILVAASALLNGAGAQSVALSGVLGSKALVVIDGSPPKALGVGDVHLGVKMLSVGSDQAVVEIKGQRSTVRVGEAPVSVGARRDTTSSNKIVLPLGSGGHFMAQGSINGKPIQFMVDTGATSIAMGISDAKRIGIDYQKGQLIRMGTANGVAQGWRVKLSSVRIGDVEVFEVDAVVGPEMPFALLGNSFLSRFSMNRTSDQMVLERRY
jgi:aspartyl protease family protein